MIEYYIPLLFKKFHKLASDKDYNQLNRRQLNYKEDFNEKQNDIVEAIMRI